MKFEIDDSVVGEFKALKGEFLSLNRYGYNTDERYDDGLVISCGSVHYFIEAHTKWLADKYQVHVLVIDKVDDTELNENINLQCITEGSLSELIVFNHYLRDAEIDGKALPEIESDCAMMIIVDGETNVLVYPVTKPMEGTGIERDTDKILDVINELELKQNKHI